MSYIEGENKIRRWKISWDLVETLKKKKLRPDERFCEESRRICSKRENVRPRNRVTRWEGLALGAPISRNVGKVPARHDLSGSMCNKKIYGCEVLRAVIFFFFFSSTLKLLSRVTIFQSIFFTLRFLAFHFFFFFHFLSFPDKAYWPFFRIWRTRREYVSSYRVDSLRGTVSLRKHSRG